MTRTEFVDEMQQKINEFDRYWTERQMKRPMDFPEVLSEEGWQEQFLVFMDMS